MARSNRSKYANLDYVLMGKPGKRRWHKREQMTPNKRLDVGISFLDSSAALYNRNRRERNLLKRAIALPGTEEHRKEKRRGLIRGIAYGTFVSAAVVASVYGIASMHRLHNAALIKEASEDLVRNLKKRSDALIYAINLTDKATAGAIDARMNGARLPKNFTGGFIDAQRRNLQNVKSMRRARLPYPAPPGEINAAYSQLKESQEQIAKMVIQLKSAVKSKDMSPTAVKYRVYATNILNRIEATNIDEILTSDNKFMDLITNHDKDFARTVRKIGDSFEMLDEIDPNNPIWRGASPDQVFSEYVVGDLEGFGSKVDFDNISGKEASAIAKGLRDDIVDAFNRRRSAISEALRAGDPPPPPGLAAVPYRYKGKAYATNSKRKRPLFMGNTRLQSAVKVAKGLGAAFNPIPQSEEGRRVAKTTLAAIGTSLGAAHAGAQLANTASTAIINNIEDREQAEDTRFREALIRNRLRSEYEQRGGMRQGKVSVHPNEAKSSATSRKKANVDDLFAPTRSATRRKGKDMLGDVNRGLLQGSRRSR